MSLKWISIVTECECKNRQKVIYGGPGSYVPYVISYIQ